MAANYLTVTLESYRADLAARYPLAPALLVPHGTFDTNLRPLVPASARPLRIVTMGKFGTYKRLETLIDAFRLLRPTHPGLELVIGGSDHPNTPGYLAATAATCTDDPANRFHGYVAEDDIPAFFGDARVIFSRIAETAASSAKAFYEYSLSEWTEVPGSKVTGRAIRRAGLAMLRLIAERRLGLAPQAPANDLPRLVVQRATAATIEKAA